MIWLSAIIPTFLTDNILSSVCIAKILTQYTNNILKIGYEMLLIKKNVSSRENIQIDSSDKTAIYLYLKLFKLFMQPSLL